MSIRLPSGGSLQGCETRPQSERFETGDLRVSLPFDRRDEASWVQLCGSDSVMRLIDNGVVAMVVVVK